MGPRRLLERLGDEVAPVEVDGTAAYALAADLASPGTDAVDGTGLAAGGSRTVRLLPAFDQYVVTATLQAEHLLPGPFKARVYRPQGWLSPVLLVGGRMEGLAPGGQGPARSGDHRAVRRSPGRLGQARRRGRGQ
ncbi:MAG: crosslink repair DNA glycosylase YcaQ family protein, partial [Actinomycetes bacterium]